MKLEVLTATLPVVSTTKAGWTAAALLSG